MQDSTIETVGDSKPSAQTASPEVASSPTTPSQDPIEALQALLEQLKKEQETLKADIGMAKDGIKSAEEGLGQLEGRQKELAARKTALENLLKGAEAGQEKIEEARAEASQAAQEAWSDHQQITEDLADQLNTEYQEMLNQAIETVDTIISGLKDRQTAINQELAGVEAQLEGVKKAVLEAKNALSSAEQALRGLPRLIQATVTQVKQLQTAMKDAFEKGCPKDSFLHAADLKTALETLGGYVSQEYEQQLKEAINAAWQALKELSVQETQLSEALKQHQDELASVETDLKDYTDNRRQKIKEELEISEDSQDEQTEAELASSVA